MTPANEVFSAVPSHIEKIRTEKAIESEEKKLKEKELIQEKAQNILDSMATHIANCRLNNPGRKWIRLQVPRTGFDDFSFSEENTLAIAKIIENNGFTTRMTREIGGDVWPTIQYFIEIRDIAVPDENCNIL